MEKDGALLERQSQRIDWLEPFDWEQPPEWDKNKDLYLLTYELLTGGPIEAGTALLLNRESAKEHYGWDYALHTPPAAEHYRHTYLWDSGFFMIIYSQAALFAAKAAEYLEQRLDTFDDPGATEFIRPKINELCEMAQKFQRAAIEEGFWLMDGQRPDGFLANVQYADGFKWYEIEKALSIARPNRTSSYSQPPVVPLAVLSVYKSMEQISDEGARLYLEEIYGSCAKLIGYWYQYRSNSADDKLVGIVDPHEGGMDSLRQWDYIKPFRRPRHPQMTQEEADHNMFADGAHFVVRLLERRVLARGNLKKERQLFWSNDVAMNCIYFHNIQAMARLAAELGKTDDEEFYRRLADQVEQAILNKLWQEDSSKVPKPGLYSLDAEGHPIKTITISNLFGLLLPHMPEKKLKAVVLMMDQDFDAPYPLPSDSINSPEYDPHNQEKDRLWRGPTWINTNYYLVEHGLRMQAQRQDIDPVLREKCSQWASLIAQKSNELIDINQTDSDDLAALGAYEHYDSELGQGQRPRVINFGWTWLARLMRY